MLIGVLLAGGVVSFVVPQRNKPALTLYEEWSRRNPLAADAAKKLGLDDVFGSPVMLISYALLATNLAVCTTRRIQKRLKRRVSVVKAPPSAVSIALPASTNVPDFVETAASAAPVTWKVYIDDRRRDRLLIDGGYIGFIGSIVMHLGLVLLMIGGVVSALTRFEGSMALTVGQVLPDTASSYTSEPIHSRFGAAYPEGTIGLRSLQFKYEAGQITSVEAELEFADASGPQVQKVRINQPARWQGKSFLLYSGGHAVPLRVADSTGKVLVEGVVRLGERVSGGYADKISLPASRTLGIRTLADAENPMTSESEPMLLRDPRVSLSLAGQESSATLAAGQSTSLGDLKVTVGAPVLWTTLLVRKDDGIPLAYLSFALIVIGSGVRILLPKRSVAMRLDQDDDGTLTASLWSRNRSAAEERIIERIVQLASMREVE